MTLGYITIEGEKLLDEEGKELYKVGDQVNTRRGKATVTGFEPISWVMVRYDNGAEQCWQHQDISKA